MALPRASNHAPSGSRPSLLSSDPSPAPRQRTTTRTSVTTPSPHPSPSPSPSPDMASHSHPPRRDAHDGARGRYSHISTDAFTEDFYPPRRGVTRWAGALAAAPAGVYKASVARFGRRRGPALLGLCGFALVLATFVLHSRFVAERRSWPLVGAASTVVFGREQLRKIWEWEILAGHYPSVQPIPTEIGLTSPPSNPVLPSDLELKPPTTSDGGFITYTVGTGAGRIYPEVKNRPSDYGHPPRPIPGSVADLDIILEHCDFATGKYVRDCLELLRLGAGLDSATRLRREEVDYLRYIFVLDGEGDHITRRDENTTASIDASPVKRAVNDWEYDLPLPPHSQYNPANRQSSPCVEDDPRIFHMFWAGAFTDKPYMAMLSFLFTQNLGLHLENPASDHSVCRPQLWLWVSRGAPDGMPRATAEEEMYEELRSNHWASPFLHPRFKDVIKFRLWNTTEQLDGVDELRDDWRRLGDELLTTQGSHPKGKGKKVGSSVALDGKTTETSQTYNKLPVILSDLVRFVLCHRYGGIYLDVDMLFLRDWEELWGWPGSFSYRWSLQDRYNTAVLRLRRGSALGTFLLRTALRNGFDFHPITVSRYLRQAHMEPLLFRIPDALFDPAWLNTDHRRPFPWLRLEYMQRDRPPLPYFTDFSQFFDTPLESSAAPSVVGFEGFFRGAYLYHYHNEWWKPFDAARFWPDLGPRFAEAEKMGRAAIANKTTAYPVGIVRNDQRDLDWSAVLKRTFEAYIRGERPNMYGEWIRW
ncbi:hypothetical protein BD413DRAFT_509566 [Trametes elegans]|nr:hypothetical protein BD413DRAFT_509566 [Trametes elegans]